MKFQIMRLVDGETFTFRIKQQHSFKLELWGHLVLALRRIASGDDYLFCARLFGIVCNHPDQSLLLIIGTRRRLIGISTDWHASP